MHALVMVAGSPDEISEVHVMIYEKRGEVVASSMTIEEVALTAAVRWRVGRDGVGPVS